MLSADSQAPCRTCGRVNSGKTSNLRTRFLPNSPLLAKAQAIREYAPLFLRYKFFGDNTRGQHLMWRFPKKYQRMLIPDWYDTHAAL